ncbi:MAG: prepilin-type N-terminal cleavage/methylation domain-containing protein [Planctomycetes bacterium]|nr:prepilin-type N-terminal cleavage/methylation domain-containing protein [Planctomycetota bacterium]
MSARTSSRGFTLLEMVIVVAILAAIAGLVAPAAMVLLRQADTDETVLRLDSVGEAAYAYFQDTLQMPATLDDLTADPGVSGWSGPYISSGYVADATGVADVEVDGFGEPFALTLLDATTLRIRSYGSDRAAGGNDDLDRVVNGAPVLREITLERMSIFNAAILSYNRNYVQGQPVLPADVAAAFDILVSAGYLPNDTDLLVDGFGDAFLPDPEGQVPMVAVYSPNVGGSELQGGGGGGGKGKGKGKGK